MLQLQQQDIHLLKLISRRFIIESTIQQSGRLHNHKSSVCSWTQTKKYMNKMLYVWIEQHITLVGNVAHLDEWLVLNHPTSKKSSG
jgi:hypothetical protein